MNTPTQPLTPPATHIRCHQCGKWFKKLGTHLRNGHGMSPGEYRVRHGLAETDLLVAPALLEKMQRNAATMNLANDAERERHRQRLKDWNG